MRVTGVAHAARSLLGLKGGLAVRRAERAAARLAWRARKVGSLVGGLELTVLVVGARASTYADDAGADGAASAGRERQSCLCRCSLRRKGSSGLSLVKTRQVLRPADRQARGACGSIHYLVLDDLALLVRRGDLSAVSSPSHPVPSEAQAVFDRRAACPRSAVHRTGRAVSCCPVAACKHLVIFTGQTTRRACVCHRPAGHMQSSSDELANGDMRPDGQEEQEGPSSRRPGVGWAGFAGGLRAPGSWGRIDVEVPSYTQQLQALGRLVRPAAEAVADGGAGGLRVREEGTAETLVPLTCQPRARQTPVRGTNGPHRRSSPDKVPSRRIRGLCRTSSRHKKTQTEKKRRSNQGDVKRLVVNGAATGRELLHEVIRHRSHFIRPQSSAPDRNLAQRPVRAFQEVAVVRIPADAVDGELQAVQQALS
eukprot:521154-Hanusia_phi.AAC.3